MKKDRKERLIDLGAEALADALLQLADRHDAADDLVERMIASPSENIERFKAKLASLRRSWRTFSAAMEMRFVSTDPAGPLLASKSVQNSVRQAAMTMNLLALMCRFLL